MLHNKSLPLIALIIIQCIIISACSNMIDDFSEGTSQYLMLLSDKAAPGEVSNITAVSGDGVITLSWTNPLDSDFDHCELWYGTDGTADMNFPGSIDPDGTSITGLLNLTVYTFLIKTVDTKGNISKGITVAAIPVDFIPPGEVSDVMALIGEGEITLSWTSPPDIDFDHCTIFYGTGGMADTEFTGTMDPSGTVITGLANAVEYTFLVQTVDIYDNTSTGVTITAAPVDITAPAEVAGLIAEAGENAAILRWTNPPDIDFDHCTIFYGTGGIADTEFTGTIDSSGTVIEGLANGTEYTFLVKTVDIYDNVSVGVTVTAVPIYSPGDGSDGALIFTTTVKEFGNLVEGVDYTYDGDTLYLKLNRPYQFTEFTLGSGTIVTTADETGVGLFIKVANTATIEGTVDLEGVILPGHRDETYSCDGTEYALPGVADGGDAYFGGVQNNGFGGAGNGGKIGSLASGGTGGDGGTPIGAAGQGANGTDGYINGGNGGTSAGGGGAIRVTGKRDGVYRAIGGNGGATYGANGGNGHFNCGSVCYNKISACGGGGAGGIAGTSGLHFVLKARTINISGDIITSGTNGGNGGNGGIGYYLVEPCVKHANNIYEGRAGGGGGGGNAGNIELHYQDINDYSYKIMLGGNGGTGGSAPSATNDAYDGTSGDSGSFFSVPHP